MTQHSRAHVDILEPLRGLAALAVAYFHFTNGADLLQPGWLKASGSYGWLGVEVFFVISGFIIPYSLYQARYKPSPDLGRFLLKRVIRLDPPYFAAIAVAIALAFASAAAPGFRGSPPTYGLAQVLLHLGYLNAFFGYPWIIPTLWTLAIEFQFYLVLALVFPLVLHRLASVRLGALAILCASAPLVPHDAFLFHYMGLFALGILTCTKFVGLTSVRTYLLVLVPVFTATALTLNLVIAIAGLSTALVIAFARIRRFGPFAFLGAISYSLYLLHVPVGGRVVNLGSRYAESTAAQLGVIACALAASVLAAWVMYRFVERPARTWAAAIRYRE